jgi:serine/threonine-protein kinase RsbW
MTIPGRTQRHHEVELHSPPDDVDCVHELLQGVWAENPQVAGLERLRFETALVELSGNVFAHADEGAGLDCTLTVTVDDAQLTAVVVDTGVPLNGDITPKGMPDDLAESGRGLPLIQALVDEFTYERDRDTNRWYLMHNLQAPDAGQEVPA